MAPTPASAKRMTMYSPGRSVMSARSSSPASFSPRTPGASPENMLLATRDARSAWGPASTTDVPDMSPSSRPRTFAAGTALP